MKVRKDRRVSPVLDNATRSPLAVLFRNIAIGSLMFSSILVLARSADANDGAPTDPEAVVNALYSGFASGDEAAIQRLIAKDATWTYNGPDAELPFAGTRKGPDGVGEFFALVDKWLSGATAGQIDTIVDGNKVVVVGWEESTVKSTGGHYKVPTVHLFEVKHGKIVRFEEYIDSGTVVQAFKVAEPARGKAFYTTCAGCHGLQGEGLATMHAPALAGQDEDYLLRQLRNFRAGHRGLTEDHYGNMMVGRARALDDDRALRDVVSYIGTLPGKPSTAHASGAGASMLNLGREAYATCAVCHGNKGEGVAEIGGPVLNGLEARYIERQLGNFRSGLRGNGSDGDHAVQMKMALDALPEEHDAAVANYVATLRP